MGLEGLLQIRESAPASTDLSAAQYKFVVFDGTPELALAGAGAGPAFVLLDKPSAQGEEGAILLVGKGKVTAGGSIDAGALIAPDGNGDAVAAAAGDMIAGIALEDAADGDVFKFLAVQSNDRIA